MKLLTPCFPCNFILMTLSNSDHLMHRKHHLPGVQHLEAPNADPILGSTNPAVQVTSLPVTHPMVAIGYRKRSVSLTFVLVLFSRGPSTVHTLCHD